MNHVVLVGRLTRDPELRYIPGSGNPVANFTVAVDRDYAGKDGKKETDFIDVQIWGKSAENCANYLGKGSLVAVQGSIRVDNWKNEAGDNRKTTRVNGKYVQFLDKKKNGANSEQSEPNPQFEPSFEPSGLDPQGFQAIDDDDIPFCATRS